MHFLKWIVHTFTVFPIRVDALCENAVFLHSLMHF